MDVDTLLLTLRKRGGEITRDGDDLVVRPFSKIADLLPAIRSLKAELLVLLDSPGGALTARAQLFKDQLEAWTGPGTPVFALPGVHGGPGLCASCGEPIPASRLRCDDCRRAILAVLGLAVAG
jgi:hypothetical protein